MRFSFLHAADLHLDSPLKGLQSKSAEIAASVANASRTAFERLIDLAIAERCAFVLLAGDIFDGEWPDFRSGQYFVSRMRRLEDAGIPVFVILGNHDAENRFTRRLEFSPNVTLIGSAAPETHLLENVNAAIHGLSFAARDVTDNLVKDYPAPVAGMFNVGLLHTALTGRSGHASYAPCSPEQLQKHGYDYWALGHVHRHEIVCTDPYVVFPGNLQGRHIRETGPKGAVLVSVDDGRIASVSHQALDAVRWELECVDLTGSDDADTAIARVRRAIRAAYERAEGRALAMRLRLEGRTAAHAALLLDVQTLRDDLVTYAASVGDALWIERIDIATAPAAADAVDASIAGEVMQALMTPEAMDKLAAELEASVAQLREKLPRALAQCEETAAIEAQAIARARALAQSILASSMEGGDAV